MQLSQDSRRRSPQPSSLSFLEKVSVVLHRNHERHLTWHRCQQHAVCSWRLLSGGFFGRVGPGWKSMRMVHANLSRLADRDDMDLAPTDSEREYWYGQCEWIYCLAWRDSVDSMWSSKKHWGYN
jgi:hypothetical protein